MKSCLDLECGTTIEFGTLFAPVDGSFGMASPVRPRFPDVRYSPVSNQQSIRQFRKVGNGDVWLIVGVFVG